MCLSSSLCISLYSGILVSPNDSIEDAQYLVIDDDFIEGIRRTCELLPDQQWSESFNRIRTCIYNGEVYIKVHDLISTAHEAILALKKEFPMELITPIMHLLLQKNACSHAITRGRSWSFKPDTQESRLDPTKSIRNSKTTKSNPERTKTHVPVNIQYTTVIID